MRRGNNSHSGNDVVQDLQGHGWPIATIFSSLETVDALYHGLQVLKKHIEKKISEKWAPSVMINKDNVE